MATTWLQFAFGAALVIAAGVTLTRSADTLGKALGLSAGWAGLLILPLATSLPELVSSIRAILIDAPDLATGNLIGSNLFNITIIAIVDLVQGKGSLFYRLKTEHSMAASLSIALMAVVGLGLIIPFPSILGGRVGLDALILMALYIAAAKLLTSYEKKQLIQAGANTCANEKEAEAINQGSLTTKRSLAYFIAAAAVILFAGTYLTDAADVIALETGLGRTFVGSILLAVATSLPEVVTTSTAARLGKIDMAVGNIFGANMLNMFILGMIDPLYHPGRLFGMSSPDHLLTILMVIVISSLIIAGMINRSKKAVGVFGFESFIVVFGYLAAVAVLYYL